jgi:protein-disulfide isomerase
MNLDRRYYIALGIAAVLLLGGLSYMLAGTRGGGGGSASPTADTLQVNAYDRVMGSTDAPVTIVEYFAPSCPVCAQFDELVFPDIEKNYIDTGKVRYVMRVFLLRQDDGAAEAIARSLPDNQYHSFIQVLFRSQQDWDSEFGVTDVHGGLVRAGRVAGLTESQVDAAIQDKDLQAKINKVSSEAEIVLGVNSTPTLFINGVKQAPGGMPFDQLKPIVDDAIAKAAKK